jgi:hypothetical protein
MVWNKQLRDEFDSPQIASQNMRFGHPLFLELFRPQPNRQTRTIRATRIFEPHGRFLIPFGMPRFDTTQLRRF